MSARATVFDSTRNRSQSITRTVEMDEPRPLSNRDSCRVISIMYAVIMVRSWTIHDGEVLIFNEINFKRF